MTDSAGLVEVLGDSAACYDPSASAGALTSAVTAFREDRLALEQLREAGIRNANRYPLSATVSALTTLSEQIRRRAR